MAGTQLYIYLTHLSLDSRSSIARGALDNSLCIFPPALEKGAQGGSNDMINSRWYGLSGWYSYGVFSQTDTSLLMQTHH